MLCQRRTTCRLCGSDRLLDAIRLTPTPLANAFVAESELGTPQPVYPLDVALCGTCGHAQLRDVVEPGILFRDYVYVSGTSPTFVRHFSEYANDLAAQFRLPAGARVIDIGSNDGTLLKCFKALGFEVLGIDPAREIAHAATRAGIETIPEFLTTELADRIVRERGPCALVTANNVFAHVDDLSGFLGALRRLLDRDGLFVFEVSYLVDVFEKCLFDTIYHEHLDYHSVGPLAAFFAREGMQLIHVSRVGTHGGSIRGIAQRSDGKRATDASVANLIKLEQALGLDRPATYAAFTAKIQEVKARLGDLLGRLKSEGLVIAGFGAPAKATTLIYHLAIGPETIRFIVDDSPYKQGLYTPGMHIPVLSPAELPVRKPDLLVVLAWNFAEPIIAKNEQFLRDGGRFVVPLPEVRLVSRT